MGEVVRGKRGSRELAAFHSCCDCLVACSLAASMAVQCRLWRTRPFHGIESSGRCSRFDAEERADRSLGDSRSATAVVDERQHL